jgi:hypothetical protein
VVVGAYFYGSRTVPKEKNDALEVAVAEQSQYIRDLERKLQSSSMSENDKYMLNAIKKYGFNDVIWLALNGRYECPSSPFQKVDRCNRIEEIAVMYATINLLKSKNYGVTLESVVKNRMTNGTALFSWTPIIKNPNMSDDIFKHSLELAVNILGGNPEYEQYDFKQMFYCRESISKCSWHKSSPNIVELGLINLSDSEAKELWIKKENVSFHRFYKMKEGLK